MDVVTVTSPIGFCRAILKHKVGRAGCRHLGSIWIMENRGKVWVEPRPVMTIDCKDNSINPPVTQVVPS